MKPKLNLRWRTTTALCIVSTMAVATVALAGGNIGVSSWDLRSHPNRFTNLLADAQKPANASNSAATVKTASPIKHVIVLIGENRGLDHTFGVYKPKGKGQTISNLLSKGIVNEDGTPGPNFAQAQQFSVAAQTSYYIGAPAISKSPYSPTNLMPQPNTEGTAATQSDTGAPFKTIAEAGVEKDIRCPSTF
jgi:phospholipase C